MSPESITSRQRHVAAHEFAAAEDLIAEVKDTSSILLLSLHEAPGAVVMSPETYMELLYHARRSWNEALTLWAEVQEAVIAVQEAAVAVEAMKNGTESDADKLARARRNGRLERLMRRFPGENGQ